MDPSNQNQPGDLFLNNCNWDEFCRFVQYGEVPQISYDAREAEKAPGTTKN